MSVQSSMQFYQQVYGGAWISQGLWVAAELGLADILAKGPRSADDLARQANANADGMYRLMRALASVGVFAENSREEFELTPLAELLRSDVQGSQKAFATMMGAEFYQAWGELLYSVQTGQPGFNKRYGVPFFEYMTGHDDRHGIYDEAMTGVHGGETIPVLDAYDFGGFKTLVDIGGGNGLALVEALRRHPGLRGILFDLPGVAERARVSLAQCDVADRLQIEGGDFFSAVPSGADAYIMRHIIHDWQDDDAIAILHQCRKAMNPKGRILVVETVIPHENVPSFGKWLDLMMLLVNGRERTREEFERLFAAAGLELNCIADTSAGVSVLEGIAVS